MLRLLGLAGPHVDRCGSCVLLKRCLQMRVLQQVGRKTSKTSCAGKRGTRLTTAFRSDADGNPDAQLPLTDQLGTLGGASDPDLWRALRYGLCRYYTTACAHRGHDTDARRRHVVASVS